MSEAAITFPIGALWWRFDRYELRDDYIRPAAGARLEEYDPWLPHNLVRRGEPDGEAPYASLLALLGALEVMPAGYGASQQPYALTAQGRERLLAWCEQHGLLGMLPHVAHQVDLAPRWAPMPALTPDHLVLLRTRYVRNAFGWDRRWETYWQANDPVLEQAPKEDGALVPKDLWPAHWTAPNVLFRSLDGPEWRIEALGGAWAHFFPEVPAAERETHSYPRPYTEEFWHAYGEPVDAFLRGAAILRDAVVKLSRRSPTDEVATPRQLDVRQFSEGSEALHSLLTSVTPTLLPHQGQYLQAWPGGSLLSAFAMMAYLDLTERRLCSCTRCGKIFTSDAYQARYCSDRCRYAAQKRAYRKRVRERASGGPQKEGEIG